MLSFFRRKKASPEPVRAVPPKPSKGKRNFPQYSIGPVGLLRDTQDVQDGITMANRPHVIGAVRRIANRSALLQAYLKLIKINVIGTTGPKPTFSEVVKDADRMKLEDAWKAWAECPTVDGHDNWAGFLRRMVSSHSIDGRVFALLRTHRDFNHMCAVMPVAREWLVDEYLQATRIYHVDGMQLEAMHGIVRYPSGRTRGYLFYAAVKPQDVAAASVGYTYRSNYVPTYVAANTVCDYMSGQTVNDIDGTLSHIVPSVELLGNIAKLDSAMLESMDAAARKMAFITRTEQSEALEDEDFPLPVEAMSSHIEELPPGRSVVNYDPAAPNNAIWEYRKELIRNLSSGMGIDHASLAGDLSDVNFSSIRYGAIASRDFYRVLQDDLTQRVCKPILRYWLENISMTGELNISMESLEQAKASTWRHRSWAWVDPVKDAKAAAMLTRQGVQSPQAIATSLGVDYIQTIAEIKEAKAMMEAEGLTVDDLIGLSGEGSQANMYNGNEHDEASESAKS